MSEVSFSETTAAAITSWEKAYLAECTAPLDGMWQTFAEMAAVCEININGNPQGYAAINGEQQLLRFYVPPHLEASPILKALIDEQGLVGAVLSTAESRALATVMDFQKSVETQSIMYQMPSDHLASNPAFPASHELMLVRDDKLEAVADFAHRTLGASIDWLLSYFDGLATKQELFALWHEGEVVATGECRRNPKQSDVADVGMIVGKPHRRKGIATEMLKALSREAQAQSLLPICSTETGNIGAQKAITAAGFVSTHRILAIEF